METRHDRYETPLTDRYAGEPMVRLFSPARKVRTWRALWVALAEAERELGLAAVSEAQVEELRGAVDRPVDWVRARAIEAETRHDVMAHVRLLGEACPLAKPIVHLGATSAYVTDNADLIQLREALDLVRGLLLRAIGALAAFAERERGRPCLAFTHFQPAQPTTVGKRASLWLYDLVLDYREVARRSEELPFHGVKGTTGTQASFLELFEGDAAKVEALDVLVARKMGFAPERLLPVTGQTYPRKVDALVLGTLASIAQSAAKLSTDIRLLQGLGELEEPFGAEQVGSSAMAYKRNPMRCERIGALARHLLVDAQNAPLTAAAQWLERTLDDSANRRLAVPQCFLAADAILRLVAEVVAGLAVNGPTIDRNLRRELPFLATENILMAAVKGGGDRQQLHERLRVHAMEARRRARETGAEPDLLQRIAGDPDVASLLGGTASDLERLLEPSAFVGLAPRQVERFLAREVAPLLAHDGPRYLSADAAASRPLV